MAKTETPKAPPRISVLERRLQNPFGEPSVPIAFKDQRLIGRWFNGAISPDKVWRAKMLKGWATVTPDMLEDMSQIGGADTSPAGYITRGERGQEVLMCMPRDEFDQIQMAKTRWNTRNMGNPKAMSAEVAEAAGQKFGEEAANFLNKSRPVGSVTDNYERVQRTDGVE